MYLQKETQAKQAKQNKTRAKQNALKTWIQPCDVLVHKVAIKTLQ